ncbi:peptide/nickel transport system substrate-binding protein [Edaphobacter aggregans]|uniref:Peptide/nickel transport system substrate-binding protein n=1 Tax=Edaphobacter aggregans TaxID=570835 RepID=A0A428MDQ4_9BACT|nr:ABC transporter substrate-binding protein [Edaphobacter aggregans]RSL14996.1 peptide/nickel transport system substrate-binding protein [Edaphobacter aggregans]
MTRRDCPAMTFSTAVRRCVWSIIVICTGLLTGCRQRVEEAGSVVMIIESSPNNLDLRQGTDAQSERVGGLIFDALVKKNEHFNLQPWLATSWEQPDALTWIFHLRGGVRFHDGRPLEAEDVAWTIRSMVDGTLITAKGGAFAAVDRVEVRDRLTVVVRLKRPVAGLLFNMSDGLFGVVPRGAGRDFGLHPVGSGPFRFVSAVQDKEVIVDRNENYWAENAGAPAGASRIRHIRFAVVPDAITSALELKKGSADLASNVVTLDMVHTLAQEPNLEVKSSAGAPIIYTNFNVNDPALKDRRVRQAIACAMDRQAIVDAIWRGQARLANTLLPIGHWAAASDGEMAQYPHDIARAQQLLDQAGFHANKDGIRLRITLKTSTDETTRLMAAVLQQQLRATGIQLDIRSAEFGTFYADVTRGAFQMYALRWIGSNEDPDIFRYAYGSDAFPPKGGNRGRYSNPHIDALMAAAAIETDQQRRRADYVEVQKILADDLPGIPLWYPNNQVIHTRRIEGVKPDASGTFDFLRSAWIQISSH